MEQIIPDQINYPQLQGMQFSELYIYNYNLYPRHYYKY